MSTDTMPPSIIMTESSATLSCAFMSLPSRRMNAQQQVYHERAQGRFEQKFERRLAQQNPLPITQMDFLFSHH